MSNRPSAKQLALADDFHAPDEARGAVVSMTETATLLDVIRQAVSNPSVDPNKIEKFMDLYERAEARGAKAAYFTALSAMQDELPIIQERGMIKIGGNDKAGQKYALWEDINKAIKPVLTVHGFALSFRTGMTDSKITVTGVLSHSGGHSEETTIHLPSDTSGSKNAVQAVGSSTSYGKRYTASALLNLTTGDVDDDGNAGGNGDKITNEQAQTIRDLIERRKKDPEKFCAYFQIEAVPDLKAKDFERAVTALNTDTKKS